MNSKLILKTKGSCLAEYIPYKKTIVKENKRVLKECFSLTFIFLEVSFVIDQYLEN